MQIVCVVVWTSSTGLTRIVLFMFLGRANHTEMVIHHDLGRHAWAVPPDAVKTWAYGVLISPELEYSSYGS